MDYIKIVISVDDEYQENLIAELLELEFDGFEQQPDTLITYVPKERFSDVNRERIEHILQAYPGNGFIQSEEVIADRNWNEEWEQTVTGQQIGKFYVKPTWSPEKPPNDTLLLEIDPKMSFGTGYHETTRLMLKFLPDLVRAGDRVIDAGTGTGILAIAAAKLGAGHVLAFDIDEWSIRNVEQNILLNGVSDKIMIKKGSLDMVPDNTRAELILANIERNTIKAMLPGFVRLLSVEGNLLVSGILHSDCNTLVLAAEEHGFEMVEKSSENEWSALLLKKKGTIE